MDDAQRFAYLVTPALAAHCLEAAENRLGKSFLKAETGMPVVYLKGFTFARSL